jgi:hypothetical protein
VCDCVYYRKSQWIDDYEDDDDGLERKNLVSKVILGTKLCQLSRNVGIVLWSDRLGFGLLLLITKKYAEAVYLIEARVLRLDLPKAKQGALLIVILVS